LSFLGAIVPGVVKRDVEATSRMLDELLAVPARSPFEELEPDYEFWDPVSYCTCHCH